MNALRKPVVAALAIVGTVACSENGAQDTANSGLGPNRVALVNNQPIAESVLRVYALATARSNIDDLSAEDRSKLLDDLIGVELLRQQAEKEGLSSSRAVLAQLELQRLQLLARATVTNYLEKNPVTESEIQRVYDDNLALLSPQQYKASHILLKTQDEAEEVIGLLRNGTDFHSLAAERNEGPTDLGWFSTDSVAAPIVAAVRGLEAGTFTNEPIQTAEGFHVLLLEDTRQQPPPSVDEIRKELVAAAERKKLEDYLLELRNDAEVALGP